MSDSSNSSSDILRSFLSHYELRNFVDDRVKLRVRKELKEGTHAQTQEAVRSCIQDSVNMQRIYKEVADRARRECARIVDDSVSSVRITQRVEEQSLQRLAAHEARYESSVWWAKWMAAGALTMSSVTLAALARSRM